MLFKKKKNYDIICMVLAIDPSQQPVGYSVISDVVKISGKYYKFTPSWFDDVFKAESNIALYIRAKYTGVYPTNFDYIVNQYYSKLLEEIKNVVVTKNSISTKPTDVMHELSIKEYYKIHFGELFNQIKEYTVELDIKDGLPDLKHVLHFHDNEKEIEGFFVYYDSDFADKKYQKWFESYIEYSLAVKCKGYRGSLCH